MHTGLWQEGWLTRRRRSATAWGGLLDEGQILLAALSRQHAAAVRVVVFEHLHAPPGLDGPAGRDDWLVQTLRQSGAQLPASRRTMALALREGRCRHGTLAWQAGTDAQASLQAEVQLEAASAFGVAPAEVGFDFQVVPDAAGGGAQIHWAACLRSELSRWCGHARSAGWRLPMVEPEQQAARRAAVCLLGEWQQHWAQSPQDWQFGSQAQRSLSPSDWQQLQASPMWGPLVACGAALGALP